MIDRNHNILLLLIIVLLNGCSVSNTPSLPVVEDLEVEKYMGTWYEIARLPNRFEEGLKCVTATYNLLENGKIEVVNKGHEIANPDKTDTARGKAKIPRKDEPGKLMVTFFWPFYGKYWILDLDKQYTYALVGDPSRKYLWILSRTKNLPEEVIQSLMQKADKLGFDTSALIFTEQDCTN